MISNRMCMERPLRHLGVEESILCRYKYSTFATKEDYCIMVKLILKLSQIYLLTTVQWSHVCRLLGCRIMKAQTLGDNSQMEFMRGRRILEINPNHPIIQDLNVSTPIFFYFLYLLKQCTNRKLNRNFANCQPPDLSSNIYLSRLS